jgi:hypothetical protein
MQVVMKTFCKKYKHPPIVYKKEMTQRLKEIKMQSLMKLKNWFENAEPQTLTYYLSYLKHCEDENIVPKYLGNFQ